MLGLAAALLQAGCSIETPMRRALNCHTPEQHASRACSLPGSGELSNEDEMLTPVTAESAAAGSGTAEPATAGSAAAGPRQTPDSFSGAARKCAFQPAKNAEKNTPAARFAVELAEQYSTVGPLTRYYQQTLKEDNQNYLAFQNREDVQNLEKCLYLSAPLGNKMLNAAWAAARMPCSLAEIPADSPGSEALKKQDRSICARLARDFLVQEQELRSELLQRRAAPPASGMIPGTELPEDALAVKLRTDADSAAANSNFWLQRLVNTYGKKQAWATAGRVYLQKEASRAAGLRLLLEASYLESADNLREAETQYRNAQEEQNWQEEQKRQQSSRAVPAKETTDAKGAAASGTAATDADANDAAAPPKAGTPAPSESANFLWEQVLKEADRAAAGQGSSSL